MRLISSLESAPNGLPTLAVERPDGKPTAPTVYLSGNGPLVQVLQYELRGAGRGKAFVRDVKGLRDPEPVGTRTIAALVAPPK